MVKIWLPKQSMSVIFVCGIILLELVEDLVLTVLDRKFSPGHRVGKQNAFNIIASVFNATAVVVYITKLAYIDL